MTQANLMSDRLPAFADSVTCLLLCGYKSSFLGSPKQVRIRCSGE